VSCGDLNRFVVRNTCTWRVTSFLRLLNSRQGSGHIPILDVTDSVCFGQRTFSRLASDWYTDLG
jgi:hypothetical protein